MMRMLLLLRMLLFVPAHTGDVDVQITLHDIDLTASHEASNIPQRRILPGMLHARQNEKLLAMNIAAILEQAAECADNAEALHEVMARIPTVLDEFRKPARPPRSQAGGNMNSLDHRIHYLVAKGALSKAMQALVTSGFQLPQNADQQVKQHHFANPVMMSEGMLALFIMLLTLR